MNLINIDHLVFLDTLIRFSSIGILIIITSHAFISLKKSKIKYLLILSCTSMVFHLIGTSPIAKLTVPDLIVIFRFLDVGHLIFFILLFLYLINPNVKIRKLHVIWICAYVLVVLAARFAEYVIADMDAKLWGILANVCSIVLVIQFLLYYWKKKNKPNLLRFFSKYKLILVISILSIIASFVELSLTKDFVRIYFFKSLFISIGIFYLGLNLLKIERRVLLSNYDYFDINPRTLASKPIVLTLIEYVNSKKPFLNGNIKIKDVSKEIGISDDKLREVIVKDLGYLNFSHFINDFRIQEIKKVFHDPKNLNTPIITIALNNGFNSIAPFNNAFKKMEGITPKKYRNSIKF